MYQYEEITTVHLELTDKCNAACPMCPRNIHGGRDSEFLANAELGLEDIRAILPVPFLQQLNYVYACGNYGDPVAARDTFEIFRYLRESNGSLALGLHSNGSARSASWWGDLGKLLAGTPHHVRFGIDGLEDTNHLYRRRTRWDHIMRNAEAFISAGGKLEWDFLVFKHNEHQVDQARALAQSMGFASFDAKRTARFKVEPNANEPEGYEVWDRDGQIEYLLEMPTRPEFVNPAIQRPSNQSPTPVGSANRGISCKAQNPPEIYVSCDGLIAPCCWLGSTFLNERGEDRRQFINLVETLGGRDQLDARRHSVRSIVESELFQKAISESWKKASTEEGQLAICARFCPKTNNAYQAQWMERGAEQKQAVIKVRDRALQTWRKWWQALSG